MTHIVPTREKSLQGGPTHPHRLASFIYRAPQHLSPSAPHLEVLPSNRNAHRPRRRHGPAFASLSSRPSFPSSAGYEPDSKPRLVEITSSPPAAPRNPVVLGIGFEYRGLQYQRLSRPVRLPPNPISSPLLISRKQPESIPEH